MYLLIFSLTLSKFHVEFSKIHQLEFLKCLEKIQKFSELSLKIDKISGLIYVFASEMEPVKIFSTRTDR